MNKELQQFITAEILPQYDGFDAAHQQDHARKVMDESLVLAVNYDVDVDMVYTIAAYHDLGLCEGREGHHLASGRIMRSDKRLLRWFTPEQIEVMAQAVEDHRASADHAPRSVYGRIVAEADRNIDIDVIITRTLQYGLAHYPELDSEGHINRALQHLNEKYSRNGYLKLWIPGSKNERKLHQLWDLIDNEAAIRQIVEDKFTQITSHPQ
ncbi:MAG: HD domain-containing protein [Bacteroidaceae bacterium]|nr:HD domain-containing protein [Bacteroidaceae bacterium]